VLTDINIEIEQGKFYSIIGPNGSGKTTLLKSMSKALEPAQNTVYINGTDISLLRSKEIARKISSVPQNTGLEFEFTVMDIVLMGRSPYLRRFQSEREEDIKKAVEAMKTTNTWHLREKSINRVSGGERQRVIIARALAQDAQIMLLDEPISQLDIHHQVELMNTIKKLNREKGITVIAVLHDLNIAAQYSDYMLLLSEGRIAVQGTPEAVLTQQNIKNIYKLDVLVMDNPINGKPLIIPLIQEGK